MSRIIALSFLPLIVCVLLALGVHAQSGSADTASDDAPATVQSGTPASTGGAATTRSPGGVLGGVVGTGSLAPAAEAPVPVPAPRTGIAPAGTNEAAPQLGTSGTWTPGTFGAGAFAPGTTATGSASTYAPGTWVPGLGMMPGNVVGPNLAGSAQAPLTLPSGVAVGSDGRPARARNVGEGEGESPASAPGAAANVALPAQVFIVAPGFIPANAQSVTPAGARSATTGAGAAGREDDRDDDDTRDSDGVGDRGERDATPVDVTSADIASAPESYGDRKLTLRGRVTSVNGNSFSVTSSNSDAPITVVVPAGLSDTPLHEDVIATGALKNRDGQRVLVAESVIQIER